MLKIICGSVLSGERENLIAKCMELSDLAQFLYLVPTVQLKSKVETAFLQTLKPNSSGISAITLPELSVYLFDGLVNELMRELLMYEPPIRKYQQKMLLKIVTRQLLQSGQLKSLQSMVEYDGFYEGLLKSLQEIKATGQKPNDWLSFHLPSSKEQEIGLIYSKYEEMLTKANLSDKERNYQTLLAYLADCDFITNSFLDKVELVVIDGFNKLNQQQLHLIKMLLKLKKEIWVHICAEEGRSELFATVWEMKKQLEVICEELGQQWSFETMEKCQEEIRSKVLQHLCTNLFDLAPLQINGDGSIEIFHTPDCYEEVQLIGRQIKSALLQDETLSLDEVAVIFRNLSPYHLYIEEVFRELGLPYEISSGSELLRTPIFKLILKIYRIFSDSYSRESVLEVIKSPYLDFGGPGMAEIYEELVLEAGVIGGESEWEYKCGHLYYLLSREINQLKNNPEEQNYLQAKLANLVELQKILGKFFKDLAFLAKSQNFRQHSQALLDFLTEYHLNAKVLQVSDKSLLRRDLLSLQKLESLLSELVQFAGLITLSSNKLKSCTSIEYVHYLTEAAKDIAIPELKAKYDAVQILTPSESRGCKYKLVFIGGLLEGEFPWYGYRDWLFLPEERRILKERGIHLKQFGEQVFEERLFFLEAISTAGLRLVLTIPALLQDEKARSSSFIQEVINLFTKESLNESDFIINHANRTVVELFDALTLKELDEVFLKELWDFVAVADEETAFGEMAARMEEEIMLGPAVQPKRLQNLFLRGEMIKFREKQQFNKYDGLLNQSAIKEHLASIYHSGRVYSVSQLNDYAICPFQFFCKRILRLGRVEEPILRLEPLDLGNLYHQILFIFFRDFPGWQNESLEDALKRLTNTSTIILTDHPAGFNLPKGLWLAYQAEIIENLKRLVTFEYEEAEDQEYRLKPAYFEVSFGLKEDLQEEGTLNYLEPVTIRRTIAETGTDLAVKFGGKIDRIDMTDDGRCLIIYDYKTGRRGGYEDIDTGIDLQLPIYVKAIQMLCGNDKKVLGASYFSILKCERQMGFWHQECTDYKVKGKSYLNTEDWEKLLAKVDQFVIDYLQAIKMGDFRLNPVKCSSYCKFKKICRYEKFRISQKLKGSAAKEVNEDVI